MRSKEVWVFAICLVAFIVGCSSEELAERAVDHLLGEEASPTLLLAESARLLVTGKQEEEAREPWQTDQLEVATPKGPESAPAPRELSASETSVADTHEPPQDVPAPKGKGPDLDTFDRVVGHLVAKQLRLVLPAETVQQIRKIVRGRDGF